MTLSLMAVPAFAAGDDETGGSAATAIAADTTTLANGDYVLSADVTLTSKALTVPDGVTATLNLGTHKLTNAAGNHTIVVELGGTLTITGSGTVDNVSHGKAAIFNNGTVILNGGTYDRSAETGSAVDENGENSWYTILNHGTMTINDGVKVTTASGNTDYGRYSSLVENGYYRFNDTNSTNGYVSGTNAEFPKLTIHGGTFEGGLNTIKNDDNGTVTINGGSFGNYYQCVIMNHNVAAITGGTFTAAADSDRVTYGVYNCGCDATHDVGSLTITGGTFTGANYGVGDVSITAPTISISGESTNILAENYAVAKFQWEQSGQTLVSNATISITGGTFSSDVSQYVPTGYKCTESEGTYTVDTYAAGELEVKPETTEEGSVSATLDGNFASGGTVTNPGTTGEDENVPSGVVSGNNVSVTLPTEEGTTTASLNVAAGTVSSLATGNATLTIDSGVGKLEVSAGALDRISTSASGSAVTITMKDTTASHDATGIKTYTLTATAGSSSVFGENGASEDAAITVSIPWDGELPTVYYVADNGTLTDMNATLDGGYVQWIATHFSDYMVVPQSTEDLVTYTTESEGTKTGTLAEALSAVASSGGTINLLDNVSMTQKANISKDVTINGNGFTITGDEDNNGVYFEVAGGTFTLDNVTLDKFGPSAGTNSGVAVIKVPGTADAATKIVANDVNVTNYCRSAYDIRSGSFEITGGTINPGAVGDGTNNRLTKGIMAGMGSNKVTGTVTDVTITNSASNYDDWNTAGIEVYKNADVTVSGGSITNVENGIHVDNYYSVTGNNVTGAVVKADNVTVSASNDAIRVYGNGTNANNETASITVNGGSYTGDIAVINGTTSGGSTTSKETVSVNNATVNGTIDNADGVMGFVNSTITNADTDDNSETGVTYVNTSVNGTVTNTTVTDKEAMIGGVQYNTLEEAIEAAKDGDVVTLLNNATLNGSGKGNNTGIVEITANITIEGNGKIITAENVDANEATAAGPSMITIKDGANVTVRDLIIDGKGSDGNDATDNTKHGLNIYGDTTTVTVENVTIKNGNGYAIVANGADVTVDGLTTSGNGWGGINVDSKSGVANLTIKDADISESNSVKIENTSVDETNKPEDPTVKIQAGNFKDIVLGDSINANTYKESEKMVVSGGTFARGSEEGAVNIADYLADGKAIDGNGNVYTPSHGGSSGSSGYAITVPSNIKNGDVTVSPSRATAGTVVTITVKPDAGYELDSLTVTDKNGKTVALKDIGNNKYTFTMPSGAVKIAAEFVEETPVSTLPFDDVAATAWYYDAVEYVYDNGLMNGTASDTFAPNATLTRGMLATVLWRMEGSPVVNYALPFEDVSGDQWYTEAIRWAASVGVVNGTSATTYAPNANITREQLATMLYRYAAYKSGSVSTSASLSGFTDAGSVSDYAADAMEWAVAEEIIGGMTSTTLVPQGSATRAQTATMLMRYCENVL